MGNLARKVEIDHMAPEEGALFLLRRAGLIPQNAPLENASQANRAQAEELVHEVGGLPLALDQAGAYFETWPRCQRLLPHAQACADLIVQRGFSFPGAARLLNQAGYYLKERAQYQDALPLLQRALVIYEQELGPSHPDTANSLNDLAGLYLSQGNYSEALPLYQQALSITEQRLGPSHPHTMIMRTNFTALQRKMQEKEYP
jgi:tetratricopeptide (TPR) repeat protein